MKTPTMSARQGILVRFLGPTNTRPVRYKAISASGISVTVSDPMDGNQSGPQRAVKALCEKLNWDAAPFHGAVISSTEWAFVNKEY